MTVEMSDRIVSIVSVYEQGGMFIAVYLHATGEYQATTERFSTLDALLAHVAAELARRRAEQRIPLAGSHPERT